MNMKTLCVATLVALMVLVSAPAGIASAEDELGFPTLSVRLAFFQADEENPHDRVCLVDTHYEPNHDLNTNRCCPIKTSDILVRYSITEFRADGSSSYGTGWDCIPRDNTLRVADADS